MTEESGELQRLIDRQEILDCVHRYARALDRHDDEMLRSVFHDDAIDNHGPWTGGREEFVRWANHECHNGLAAHSHHITTHNCEIDGDVAHAESYVLFLHRHGDGERVLVGSGRYVDRLERPLAACGEAASSRRSCPATASARSRRRVLAVLGGLSSP